MVQPVTKAALSQHDVEFRRLQPTPIDHKYESSASSVSSAEEEHEEQETAAVATRKSSCGWHVKHPKQWADNRVVQIEQGLLVFYHAGFIHYDTVVKCTNWAGFMLAVVLVDPSAWEMHAMASSSYWAIHLCQIGFALQDSGEGYKICGRSRDELHEKKECWSLNNMHKVLSGDKSKRFKDFSKGGTYVTDISSEVARKNKIAWWSMRGDERTKHLDIRPLGDETMQERKTASFFQVWDAADLPQGEEQLVSRIRDRRPPDTHLYSDSHSAKSEVSKRVMSSSVGMIAMKAINRTNHCAKRAVMGPVCGSGIKSDMKAALLNKPRPRVDLPMESSDDELDDNGMPMAHRKGPSSRNCGVEANESDVLFGRAEAPSDDEEDRKQNTVDLLEAALKSPMADACNPETRNVSSTPSEDGVVDDDDHPSSSDDSEEESSDDESESGGDTEQSDVDTPDGPREEGVSSTLPENLYAHGTQILKESLSIKDRDKVERALDAKRLQHRGQQLTKGQLALLDWLSKIDLVSLREGNLKINRRKAQPTFDQLQKRLSKEAEARRRKEATELLRVAREDLQVELRKQLDEKSRERLQNRLKKLEAKEARKTRRHHRRVERANFRLNNTVRKQREQEQSRKRKYQEQAAKKLEYAKKRKISAAVRTGPLSMTILLHQKEEDPPIREQDLIASTYINKFAIERRLAQRSTNAVSVAMPSLKGKGESVVRVVMKPRPGKRGGTRASAAASASAAPVIIE
jgi:hypothetical protein